jgi:hypothetical protein
MPHGLSEWITAAITFFVLYLLWIGPIGEILRFPYYLVQAFRGKLTKEPKNQWWPT